SPRFGHHHLGHQEPAGKDAFQSHCRCAHPTRRLPHRDGRAGRHGPPGSHRRSHSSRRAAGMKIVSAAEMRDIDRVTCSKYKVPSLTLMENAGSAVAEYILQHYPDCNSVGVICGKGNNGGDGFVSARRLHEAGKSVRVLLLAASKDVSGDAAKMLKRLPVKPLEVRNRADLKKLAKQVYAADVLVDALLGTGYRPPVSDLYSEAIALFWKQSAPIVSVDIPSGLEADATEAHSHSAPHVPASATVTFTAAKPALVL